MSLIDQLKLIAVPISLTAGSGLLLLAFGWTHTEDTGADPWEHLPEVPVHTDHSTFFPGELLDGPAVTRACLECHEDAADQVMHTAHWKWEGDPVVVPGHEDQPPMAIGKKNVINNYCIGVQSNWPACTKCHAGYGWKDESFDFSQAESVDCLVCHDQSGGYLKANAGLPAEGVDLLAAAKSVGRPPRNNCGACHFSGGGGDAVKHGDLDTSILHPNERIDVHMGRHDFQCVDCHQAEDHAIPGRAISVSVDDSNRVECTDCHAAAPHEDERINAHIQAVACQTCHIPAMGVDTGTKMSWDWSTGGDLSREEQVDDPHQYMAKKGTFTWEYGAQPEYAWYDGRADRYLLGEVVDPSQPTVIAGPLGGVGSADAKIWPFKVHRGKQPYDLQSGSFMVPKTFGEGGYWTEYDWDKALRLGAQATGLPFSGEYGFAPTEMYWPLSHMVQPKDRSLQCEDCHGDDGRMDWAALGYTGDPATHGGRAQQGVLR